jgi:hypothetical protein
MSSLVTFFFWGLNVDKIMSCVPGTREMYNVRDSRTSGLWGY